MTTCLFTGNLTFGGEIYCRGRMQRTGNTAWKMEAVFFVLITIRATRQQKNDQIFITLLFNQILVKRYGPKKLLSGDIQRTPMNRMKRITLSIGEKKAKVKFPRSNDIGTL